MLRIAIPKGSLEEGTFNLFKLAGLPIIRRNKREYRLKIFDPRITETFLLRPQEIPKYIEEGEFDIGITGYDWIYEKLADVIEVTDLKLSKSGWSTVKIVLATDNSNPINNVENINTKSRVVTEYPRITRSFFRSKGKGKISIRLSHGATEVKVPRLADYLVDVTETGETLKINNKKILTTILESSTKLIANKKAWEDEVKRTAINEIATLLLSVINARDKVLIKMNIARAKLSTLIKRLTKTDDGDDPFSLRPPTVSPIYSGDDINNSRMYMVETVVDKDKLKFIIPEIKKIGAEDILELGIAKRIT